MGFKVFESSLKGSLQGLSRALGFRVPVKVLQQGFRGLGLRALEGVLMCFNDSELGWLSSL